MEDANEEQRILLPISKLIVDVKSMEANDAKSNDDYYLTKAASSEAMKRVRPDQGHKK